MAINGVDVCHIRVNMWLRDWSKKDYEKQLKESKIHSSNCDYPAFPYKNQHIFKYHFDKIEKYIVDQLQRHEDSENLDDSELHCTRDEKWQEDEKYKIYTKTKDGKKWKDRADRVLNTYSEDVQYVDNTKIELDKIKIEKHESYCRRCEEYCVVRDICQQRKREREVSK